MFSKDEVKALHEMSLNPSTVFIAFSKKSIGIAGKKSEVRFFVPVNQGSSIRFLDNGQIMEVAKTQIGRKYFLEPEPTLTFLNDESYLIQKFFKFDQGFNAFSCINFLYPNMIGPLSHLEYQEGEEMGSFRQVFTKHYTNYGLDTKQHIEELILQKTKDVKLGSPIKVKTLVTLQKEINHTLSKSKIKEQEK